jgi:hypothetical protein
MAFTPRRHSRGLYINPIIEGIRIALDTNYTDALEWVKTAHDSLDLILRPNVEPAARSRRKREQFPYCSVLGENSQVDKSDQKEYTGLVHNITIEIGDTDADSNLLDEILKLRAHAVVAILDKMEPEEIMNGAEWNGGIPDLTVTAMNYQMSNQAVEGVYVGLVEISVEVGINQQ